MKKLIAGLMAAGLLASAANAEIYIRHHKKKGDQEIDVTIRDDGTLWCTRVSDGFEMCNGMTEGEDHLWRGKNMRHPDMPKWMKFNGTVTFVEGGLNIKGCAVICDSEDWTKAE